MAEHLTVEMVRKAVDEVRRKNALQPDYVWFVREWMARHLCEVGGVPFEPKDNQITVGGSLLVIVDEKWRPFW